MNRMTVATFNDRSSAEHLQRRMAEHGIKAEIHDELRLEKLWFVSKLTAGVRLEVPCNDFEKCEKLLAEWDSKEGALYAAIRCPECRSFRVQFPQFAHKSVIPNILMGFLASVGRVNKAHYCEDCHYTWPKEGSEPSKLRPHMAPYYFIEGIEQTRSPQPKEKRQAV
jgi:predicted Zn-ribbon and HTH transcriptional regulator